LVSVIKPPKVNPHSADTIEHAPPRAGGGGGGAGDDGQRRGGGSDDDLSQYPLYDPKPARNRLAMLVLLAGIAMMFLTLTVAYVMLVGTRGWQPIQLPSLIWLSTLLIVASSATLEMTRRAWRRDAIELAGRWITLSVLLGFGFIISQVFCWLRLAAQQESLTGSYSSFFYMLTGLHLAHIIGGVALLAFLLIRIQAESRRVSAARNLLNAPLVSLKPVEKLEVRRLPATTIDVVALYWHFVDGLWVYVLLLLMLWK
jgi:cytochrome c oxidase subunit 3